MSPSIYYRKAAADLHQKPSPHPAKAVPPPTWRHHQAMQPPAALRVGQSPRAGCRPATAGSACGSRGQRAASSETSALHTGSWPLHISLARVTCRPRGSCAKLCPHAESTNTQNNARQHPCEAPYSACRQKYADNRCGGHARVVSASDHGPVVLCSAPLRSGRAAKEDCMRVSQAQSCAAVHLSPGASHRQPCMHMPIFTNHVKKTKSGCTWPSPYRTATDAARCGAAPHDVMYGILLDVISMML